MPASKKVQLGKLKHYPGNARRGNVGAIKESLLENGQYKPLIVQTSTDYVLVGNHTLDAAAELNWKTVDVQYLDCTDEQARKIVLADNRTSDLAGYDDDALMNLLNEVDTLTGTGFDATDFAELLNRTTSIAAPEEDVKPAPAKPITKLGDLIQLGDHWLICGDARDPAAAAKLFAGGERADMIWTDPPYGVDVHEAANLRADRDWGQMEGDQIDARQLEELCFYALQTAAEISKPGAAIYVAHADQMREPVRAGMLRAGFGHRQTLIWAKNTLVIGRQDYQWKHEPILYGWKSGAAHKWYGEFDKTTVVDRTKQHIAELDPDELRDLVWALLDGEPGSIIRIDKPSKSVQHPTMKPVELVAEHIGNSSPAGGIVYDPFGGSGTTLIAAEQQGRRARLIELEPGYCDVIVDRWEQLTGNKADRS